MDLPTYRLRVLSYYNWTQEADDPAKHPTDRQLARNMMRTIRSMLNMTDAEIMREARTMNDPHRGIYTA